MLSGPRHSTTGIIGQRNTPTLSTVALILSGSTARPTFVARALSRRGIDAGALRLLYSSRDAVFPHRYRDRIGLPEILGMLRVKGLHGVLRRLKAEVTRAAIARAGPVGPGPTSPPP